MEKPMSCEQTVNAAGISAAQVAGIQQDWDKSAQTLPKGPLTFLQAPFIQQSCDYIQMPEDLLKAFLHAVDQIHIHPALQRLFWHFHHRLFKADRAHRATVHEVQSWPEMPEKLGHAGRMFYGLVFLSGLPHIQLFYEKKAIPESILKATLADLELWIRTYERKHEHPGFNEKHWLIFHFSGNIFQLGRLQFQFSKLQPPMHIFQNKQTHEIRILADEGMVFRADGQFADADREKAPGWTAHFQQHQESISGNPITPFGTAQQEKIQLPRDQWTEIAKGGTNVLAVHIPERGRMDHDACQASYQKARTFFAQYFPEWAFAGFTCHSWLLDPQLGQKLPTDSNIVQFQRDYYCLPHPSAHDAQIWDRIFGGRPQDLSKAPRATTLHHIILDHVTSGGTWRTTAGFLPK